MCDLVTALSVASSAAAFAGQSQAANEQNARNLQAQTDASVAAGWRYYDEGQRFAYNAKAIQQDGYDLSIKARENRASGIASAGTAGVSGLTLGSLVADTFQKEAENKNRLATKREDLGSAYTSTVKSIEAGAQSTINSLPYDPGPSVLGLAINVATPIAKSDWGQSTLKFN